MSQFNTDSYGTTIGSSIDTRGITGEIKKAVVSDDLDTQRENTLGVKPIGNYHALFITGTYPSEGNIPSFPHPISLIGIRNKNFICSDLRLLLRENKGGAFKDRIKNQTEYDFALTRHILTMNWAGGRSDIFRTSLSFGAFSFATWLANTVADLKRLDGNQRLHCMIAALCYYFDLTKTNAEAGEHDYRRSQIDWLNGMMKGVIRDIEHVVGLLPKTRIGNLDEYVAAIKVVLDSPLMVNLGAGAIITAVRGHWFGLGLEAQRIIGVAVEDPPTWCTLVNSALTYSGYKNSIIAQTVTRLGKRGESDSFLQSVATLKEKSELRLESIADIVSTLPDAGSMEYDTDDLVLRAESTPEL